MGILIDTSVLIAAERGTYDIFTLFHAHQDETIGIAAITASELLVGVHRLNPLTRARRSAYVEETLSRLVVVNFDLGIARLHAQLVADLMTQGLAAGVHDLQIGATALARDDRVATLDQRSFPLFKGLQLVDLHVS